MTVDPALMNVFMAVMTVLVCGIAIKIGYNWLQTGRMKTGEYYQTVQACEECRENCCINIVKTKLSDHIQNESGQDSRVDERLKNIEQKIQDAREDNSKIREHLPAFEFTPLEEGIRKTVDWFRNNYETARK